MSTNTWRGMRQPMVVNSFGILQIVGTEAPEAGFRRLYFKEKVRGTFSDNYIAAEAIKLVLPPRPVPDALQLPISGSSGPIGPLVKELGGIARVYTLRDVNPASGTFTIDFHLHPKGHAVSWALAAEPGWTVYATGKRFQFTPSKSMNSILLFGDETAVPAINEIYASYPHTPAHAIIQARDHAVAAFLDKKSMHHTVEWIQPEESALAKSVDKKLIHTDTAIWAGCEAEALKHLRIKLRRELQIPRHQVDLTGYWRRGVEQHTELAAIADKAATLTQQGLEVGNQYTFGSFEPSIDA